MSKYVQIDIRLIPFYKQSFKKDFHQISGLLDKIGYSRYLEKEKTLYEIVDIIESVVKNPDIEEGLRDKISPFYERMKFTKKEAREKLLSRDLNALDKYLYQLEDIFLDLERDIKHW